MTTDATTDQTTSGPSIHVVRARKLLLGGLVGGSVAAVLSMIAFTIVNGTGGLISAALAAALVLVFYVVGQWVMVRFADAAARTLMLASLVSYTARMGIIGMVLVAFSRKLHTWPSLVPSAVFATAIAVVIGWLAVEIFVFSRLRIGVYDTEYVSPATGGEIQ